MFIYNKVKYFTRPEKECLIRQGYSVGVPFSYRNCYLSTYWHRPRVNLNKIFFCAVFFFSKVVQNFNQPLFASNVYFTLNSECDIEATSYL